MMSGNSPEVCAMDHEESTKCSRCLIRGIIGIVKKKPVIRGPQQSQQESARDFSETELLKYN